MKALFDFLPIILFFVVYKFYGIYYATGVMMVAYVLQVGGFWLKYRRFERLHMITLACVLILGSATLFLHNDLFIKWKPTVIYWLFALVFIASPLLTKKTLLQQFMAEKITMPAKAWQKMNWFCILFFVLMGIVNLYFAYEFSTNAWVDFKLATIAISLVFFVLLALYMSKQVEDKISKEQRDDEPKSN